MARRRRRFTPEFKARVALEALREGDSVQAIAARHEVHPNQVRTWKRELLEGSQRISTLPIARQVRELQAALSINKSELARILQVSRPTVYDWLDGGEPNAGNVSRIRTLVRLVSECRVSANNPLVPRFVRSALESGDRSLLELLGEEMIDEVTVKDVIRRAKALGDAMDARREEREGRLREAGFEEVDDEQRRANLAANMAQNVPVGREMR